MDATNDVVNMNDITVVEDDQDDKSVESDGIDFEAAMKVRKNLSETFDRHASTVAEKIARLELKNAAVVSTLPPRHPSNALAAALPPVSSVLAVSLRIRPPVGGQRHASANTNNDSAAAVTDHETMTIEILPPTNANGVQTTVRTHPPQNSNARKVLRDNINNNSQSNGVKEYTFQRVFSPQSSQHEVYSTIAAPLVHGLFPSPNQAAQSALLFAYGITNAGKTFTIMGNPTQDQQSQSQWGIIPRALQDIIARLEGTNLQLTMSYMEIYNENVYDLLPDETSSKMPYFRPASLKLRESQDGSIYVKDLVKHRVRNVQEGLELAKQAKAKRHTSSNNINADSSRSHCICQLELRPVTPDIGAETNDDESSESVKFWIVDLAGSERTKRTGGVRQKEANIINTSLMKLMRCLSVMRENQGSSKAVVPFRESKLTHLFMSHLTGPSASRTTMIVNVNPAASDFDETQHVLGYAVAAKSVQIHQVASKPNALSAYAMNGHKKQSAIARLVNKYSPKMLGKRKATDESIDRAAKRVISKASDVAMSMNNRASNRAVAVHNTNTEDQLRKELISLRASLDVARAEVASLRLTCEEQAQELAHLEETVRAEVSEEMEQHFQSTRGDYDRIIENLQNQVKSNPVGVRSERKAKMDKAEKMIEELEEKVEECEEEMVRMRQEHDEAIKQMKEEHELAMKEHAAELAEMKAKLAATVEAKDAEIHRLTEEHEAEIRDMQISKDESTSFFQSQIRELEADSQNTENVYDTSTMPRRLPRSRTSKVAVDCVPGRVADASKEIASRMPFGSISENNEVNDEDLIFPKKPTLVVDGTFSRPSGRAPRGREWDAERGAWRRSVC